MKYPSTENENTLALCKLKATKLCWKEMASAEKKGTLLLKWRLLLLNQMHTLLNQIYHCWNENPLAAKYTLILVEMKAHFHTTENESTLYFYLQKSNLLGKTSEPTLQSFLVPPRQRRQKCRAADIPCKSTFNCQPGKVSFEEPTQEMQGWRGGLKDAKLISELLKETRWKKLQYSILLCTTENS